MSPAYEAVEVFDSLIKQDFFNYLIINTIVWGCRRTADIEIKLYGN